MRYCSLIGADDPLTIYTGFYGRYSHITGRWADVPLEAEDRGGYFKVTLGKGLIPTMGANGFLVRASVLRKASLGPYLFDLDVVYQLANMGYNKFARVKTSISHLYAFSLSQYIRKTYRRIRDFSFYHRRGMRSYPWLRMGRLRLARFVLFSLLGVPLVRDAIRGYRRRPDVAWFLHWPLCLLTLCAYGLWEVLSGFYLAGGIRGEREGYA